jgi:hypothetical protein
MAYPNSTVDGNGDIVHKGIDYIPQWKHSSPGTQPIGENSLGVMNERYDGGERSAAFLAEYSRTNGGLRTGEKKAGSIQNT